VENNFTTHTTKCSVWVSIQSSLWIGSVLYSLARTPLRTIRLWKSFPLPLVGRTWWKRREGRREREGEKVKVCFMVCCKIFASIWLMCVFVKARDLRNHEQERDSSSRTRYTSRSIFFYELRFCAFTFRRYECSRIFYTILRERKCVYVKSMGKNWTLRSPWVVWIRTDSKSELSRQNTFDSQLRSSRNFYSSSSYESDFFRLLFALFPQLFELLYPSSIVSEFVCVFLCIMRFIRSMIELFKTNGFEWATNDRNLWIKRIFCL